MAIDGQARTLLFAAASVGSLALHAAAVLGLTRMPPPPASFVAARPVRVHVLAAAAPPPPLPVPPPVPVPPPEPRPEPPKPKPRPKLAQPEPAPETEPASAELAPAAEPEAAPALSGVTLTANGEGPGWAASAGDGSARTEPLRVGPRTAPRPRVSPNANAPAVVALASLSRRPSPPALDGVLERQYPAEARRRGLEGTAIVRARIDADGRVRTTSIASETRAGFGAACQRTLLGSRWTPPLDRHGRAVSTEVRYTCRFRIEP